MIAQIVYIPALPCYSFKLKQIPVPKFIQTLPNPSNKFSVPCPLFSLNSNYEFFPVKFTPQDKIFQVVMFPP